MLPRVALVRTDVSEESIADIIRVTRISVLRLLITANVLPSSPILLSLMIEAIRSSETLVLTRDIRRNVPGDGILHGHHRGNLKSYTKGEDERLTGGEWFIAPESTFCIPFPMSRC
jgi:hypothetical protein